MSYQQQQTQQQTPQPQTQRMVGPPQVSHRLNELLEAIKQEFVSVSSEASAYLMHKDQFDQKMLTQHMAELQQVRKNIYELDMAHRKMKEQYEDEIMRLKRQLEHNIPPPPQPQSAVKPPQTQPAQQGTPLGAQATSQPPQQDMYAQPPVHVLKPQPSSGNIPQPPQQQQQQQQQQPNYYQNRPPQQQPLHQMNRGPNTPQMSPSMPQPQQQPASQQQPQQMPQQQQQPAQQSTQQQQPQHQHQQVQAPQQQQQQQQQQTQQPPPDSWEEAVMLGNNLAYIDTERVPPHAIKSRDDWLVLYNERAPRQLDVDIVHALEHVSVVCCVRFSNDGKYLATGCNRSAQIYDVQSGQLLCRLQDESVDSEEDLYIRSVCFSPDSKYLAAGAEDHQIRVWDIQTRKLRYLFTGHEQDIYSLDISRNGKHIASGSGDGTVRIWDLETGQCVLTLSIDGGVTAVSFSPDGRFVAAGSLDYVVRVWDTQTGMLVETLEAPDGHKDSVYSVTFTPNGLDLVSGSLDKTIKVWELQTPRGLPAKKGGVCKKTILGHEDFVLSVATTPDGKWILSGSKDRGVQFWDPNTRQAQLMLQAHKNSVISVAPSPVGMLFATGSGDFWAKIWRYYPVQ